MALCMFSLGAPIEIGAGNLVAGSRVFVVAVGVVTVVFAPVLISMIAMALMLMVIV